MKVKYLNKAMFVLMIVVIAVFFGNKIYQEYKAVKREEANTRKTTMVETIAENATQMQENMVLYLPGEAVETGGLLYTVEDFRILQGFPEEAAIEEDRYDSMGFKNGVVDQGFSVVEVKIKIQYKNPDQEEYCLANIWLCDGEHRKEELFTTDKVEGLYSKDYFMYYPEEEKNLEFKLYYIIKDSAWNKDSMYIYIHNQGIQKYEDKARKISLRK